ncbi:type II secretory protein PulC [Sphingomonas sp. NBWT7]|uniref:type II secretion system protein N n=1 Tax=Sphingomonas sp. NBWT7 TaxID=2596913 RepID=UPI001625E36E|nr:type II secretion system protein N [Sphingomonas sp. NBWT7]QNE30728.1 type II secretory protein PulC [Sphingomonas sp. NBWT7]
MRLSFDARARAILRRVPVVNVYSLAELALLGVLAVQTARLVWTVVTPVSPLGEWRPAGLTVPAAPGDVLRGFDPFYRIGGVQAGPAVVTSLQLKLFGTRIDEAMGRGSAILAGPDGVQKSVAIGEEIIPGVVLRAVAFDHVTIERGGAREDLFLDQSGGNAAIGAPASGDATLAATPAAPGGGITVDQFQSDVGFVPRIEGGRISGLVVRSQGSGAAFRAAGLRDGDVVTQLAGRPVSGAGDIDRIAAQFAGGGSLALTVDRGGQPVSLSVQVAGR